MARYFFLQVGEICKSRQRCSSTVPDSAKAEGSSIVDEPGEG